jgi:hypothetical protein
VTNGEHWLYKDETRIHAAKTRDVLVLQWVEYGAMVVDAEYVPGRGSFLNPQRPYWRAKSGASPFRARMTELTSP